MKRLTLIVLTALTLGMTGSASAQFGRNYWILRGDTLAVVNPAWLLQYGNGTMIRTQNGVLQYYANGTWQTIPQAVQTAGGWTNSSLNNKVWVTNSGSPIYDVGSLGDTTIIGYQFVATTDSAALLYLGTKSGMKVSIDSSGNITSHGWFTAGSSTNIQNALSATGLMGEGLIAGGQYNWLEGYYNTTQNVDQLVNETGAYIVGTGTNGVPAGQTKLWIVSPDSLLYRAGSTVMLGSHGVLQQVVVASIPDSDHVIIYNPTTFPDTSTAADKFRDIFLTPTVAVGNVAAHVEGMDNVANGIASHAEGYFTKATGTESHAEGRTTIASGFASHAQNYNDSASAYASTAIGFYTKANNVGEFAQGGGTFDGTTFGGVQFSRVMLAAATTDATPASMLIGLSSGLTPNPQGDFKLEDNTAYVFHVYWIAREYNTHSLMGAWKMDFCVNVSGDSASAVIEGNPKASTIFTNDTNMQLPSLYLTSPPDGNLYFIVQGATGAYIQWIAEVDYDQIRSN